ncbi:putative transcriptional regulator, TetR family protein [Actinoplanes philippinensis]|uniref:DNA-binding transcriptional regulator, AcrR family n=1 Tax=Actinoplanes philippinensis TaxID=35752 RepID=A0A1I2N4G4_9ACTN|nr:TetR/AcrR family transcriptional regulator [Actinoplanes philippinensis]GIE76307.1 putative transcriptional regulator, TetR family protein [Actinoplanes philippinensis]SFF98318.1 DNA-binding transcriptional regulator, AcrR family [Actinoplanes philippinensis]
MTSDDTRPPRTPKGRAPHRRDQNARLAVLNAADDLLVERSFSGLTIEAIAARAGVAKQTIYRWWPSKVDILMDTLVEDAGHQLPVPQEGPARRRLSEYLHGLADFLEREPAGKVLLALLGEAQHDPETARRLQERYLEPRRSQERDLIRSGIEADEFRTALDPDATLDALCGPIFYRALTGAPIPTAFVDALIAGTLR